MQENKMECTTMKMEGKWKINESINKLDGTGYCGGIGGIGETH